MSIYRKLPIEIEARQWFATKSNTDEIKEWTTGWGVDLSDGIMLDEEHTPTLDIDTLEGVISAQPGDYIVKGVNDEFYPCKPDIFEKTYEFVR